MKKLLEVQNIKTQFLTEAGVVQAVDGVSFYVKPGEVLGIVGESGCGKSVTVLSVMQLVSEPGEVVEGKVLFNGRDLLSLPERELMKIRGNQISMIFQQPQSCLNPVFKVGDQIVEVLRQHQGMNREQAKKRTIELFEMVGIPEPNARFSAYPHEFSGGMAQRAMIAMAVACSPDLLIADEPTTALDVTIQAQILDLMNELKDKLETSIILITHDLGVVAEMCDRVMVMYAGRVVEEANVFELFENPKHPYTQDLLGATPELGMAEKELVTIPGSVPNLIHLPSGCKFAPRCREVMDICTIREPHLLEDEEPGHTVRCWLYEEHEEAVGVAHG